MSTVNLQQLLCVLFVSALFLVGCKKRPPGPFLKSLSPEKGSVGTRVTVEGEDLFYFEKAYFGDAEVTETPVVTSNGERMELIVPDQAAAGPAQVYLLYEDGRSNSLQFEVTGGASGAGAPVIDALIPSTVLAGCELQILGENLDSVTVVIFPVDLEGEILSQSASQLIVQVPDNVIAAGSMFLYTPRDTVSQTIVTDIGIVPVIDRILPAANDQGGPVLVYGENLNLVNQVFFGEVEQPVFEKSSTSLQLHVPVSEDIKGKTVNFQLRTIEACFSAAVAYEVGNGVSAQSPVGTNNLNIVIPNTPGGISLPGINNNWKLIKKFWTDNPELDELPLGAATLADGVDTSYLLDYYSGDTVATYAENGSFLEVEYDGQFYYGAIDDTYADFDPSDGIISPIRFVLTPLDFGDQVELIKPLVIEVAASKKEGNTFTIKGRYFTDFGVNDYSVRIFREATSEEVNLAVNDAVTFVDNTTLEFELLDNLPSGAYQLVIQDLYEFDVSFSNPLPFEIN